MAHAIESRQSADDEIVIHLTRPNYHPRWALAQGAVSAILWSALVLAALRAAYWIFQQ